MPKRWCGGGGCFGRCLGHEHEDLMNGVRVLVKETPQGSLALPPCEDRVRSLWPRRQPPPNHAGTLTSDSSLQNCKQYVVGLISHPVYGALLKQPNRIRHHRVDYRSCDLKLEKRQFIRNELQNTGSVVKRPHLIGHLVGENRPPSPQRKSPEAQRR